MKKKESDLDKTLATVGKVEQVKRQDNPKDADNFGHTFVSERDEVKQAEERLRQIKREKNK